MSLKLKLVISFVVLASIGLAFSIATIYQSSRYAFYDHEQHNMEELAQELAKTPSMAELLSSDRYAVFNLSSDGAIRDLLNTHGLEIERFFKDNNRPDDYTLELEQGVYQWAISGGTGEDEHILILHVSGAYNFGQFITTYGTEIFIIILFTMWAVFWSALVVYSLIKRIDKQKTLLEAQTAELDKRAQEAVGTTEAKSKFLASISHEMRTPLTAIIGYSETLLHSDQPMEERLSSINTIIRNGNHLLTLINDLLDLSKIEAGKLEVESIPVNILQVLQDVEALFQQQAKAKGLELKLNYHFPLYDRIQSDPVRIKQIIINLVSNALKFTKSGYIHLDIKEIEVNKLQIQVEDSGVGMTDEQITRIFKDYSQADSSTTRKYGGTGLGLSLSKQLARMLGGDITVTSLPGLGSIFTLTIDRGETTDSRKLHSIDEIEVTEKSSVEGNVAFKLKGKVLLAEDNPDNQHLFSMYLNRFGVEFDIAHNGQQAIEYALRDDYDLILMDMQMPIMDGIEATSDLRGKGVKTPIVALTANAMKDDMDRFYQAGCDDYLTKPIKRTVLFELCSKYLQADTDGEELVPIHSSVLEEDPDFIDLVSRFSRRLPETISELHNLCKEEDFDQLAKKAHDLKGVGGNMGYQEIAELAGKMEFQIANRNAGETQYLITQLETLSRQIEQGLNAFGQTH